MSDDPHPRWRAESAGVDIGAARALYEEAFNGRQFRLEPVADGFAYRLATTGDDELALRSNRFQGHATGTMRSDGEYVVTWLVAGEGTMDLGGRPVRHRVGVPAVSVRGRAFEFDFRDFRQNLMHFDGAYLEGIAAELAGVQPGPIEFDTTATPSGQALARWSSAVAAVAAVVYDESSSPLLRAEAKRQAAVAVLEAFPHRIVSREGGAQAPAGGRVRRAVAYLHECAHLPITTEMIAEAGGMGARGMQAAFQRELGVTPMAYLRGIRLDRVRVDLAAAEPGSTTVGQAARRWGFAHLGRFAAHYAERFGEPPSKTLGR